MSMREQVAYLEQSANKATLDLFDDMIYCMEMKASELKDYKKRFVSAMKDPLARGNSPVDVLSWSINSIRQTLGQTRIDLAVQRAAELGVVMSMKRAMQDGDVS